MPEMFVCDYDIIMESKLKQKSVKYWIMKLKNKNKNKRI